MNKLKQSNETIQDLDIMIAIPSVVIAIGFLYMPRVLAEPTIGLDAIYTILLGGVITILLTWLGVSLAIHFPGQSFVTYASKLVSKPIAVALALLFALHGILITCFEVRAIAEISHLYLFNRTPIEVIGLAFLLVVIYAVAGSRVAIFRLNALFFPVILVAIFILAVFSLGFTDATNAYPFFQTDLNGYSFATLRSISTIGGFGVFGYVLFYVSLIRSPKKTPKMAMYGVILVILLHLIIFTMTLLVFGNITTSNLMFPVIELARAIELPGGFFNRFDSLFFVVWTMAIFNTTVMTYDLAVIVFQSVFKNAKKEKLVFLLAPIIFFISGLPKNTYELDYSGRMLSYFGITLATGVTLLLFVLHKVRGVK
ncbi:spore germination protein [Aquibacillus koreensis]|uniref:Spore germination protein n=1 Tax=Aquibacillus koreensis TaxID=279446 RepID=A0A9X3WIZ2_9BACI|nr:spore germination protein [Aquibacillus koreensis]MCT2536448.1 spore germination protein [Aquibacillus koreensis]MDC3419463.1 spore germination protein [Aquibacillus koreensis]